MRAIASLILALLAACSDDETISAHSSSFVTEITRAVRDADEIDVTEHSNWLDFPEESGKSLKPVPTIVYRKVSLNGVQRQHLLASLAAMKDTSESTPDACAFNPHHTIELRKRGTLAGGIDVCFECSSAEWIGSKLDPPAQLFQAASVAIADAGLSPVRNWAELAASKATP